jgi:hypothetical protein
MADITNMQSIHYSVFRTEVRRKLAEEILEFRPCLRLVEPYNGARALSMGKVKSSPNFFTYFRQQETSSLLGYSEDLVEDIVFSKYAEDLRKMCSRLALACAAGENKNSIEIESIFLREYAKAIRTHLSNTTLRYRFPRLFLIKSFMHWPKIYPSFPLLSRNFSILKFLAYLYIRCGGEREARIQANEFFSIIKAISSSDLVTLFDRYGDYLNDDEIVCNIS